MSPVKTLLRPALGLALAAVLCAAPVSASVILNTLEGYEQLDPGWSGNLSGLFSGSGGNTERILFEAGGKVQWQLEKDRLRLQASGGYEESAGLETARNVVVHLRHNRDLNEKLATVSFAQVQHNPFQQLQSRWLFGAGVRQYLWKDEKGNVSYGVTPMLELERLEGHDDHLARGRLSVFLHIARHLSDSARLDLVAFWQPLFSDFSDSRATANLVFTVDMIGEVDLKVGVNVEDNATPPVGVERTDWQTYMGLGLDF